MTTYHSSPLRYKLTAVNEVPFAFLTCWLQRALGITQAVSCEVNNDYTVSECVSE